MTSRLNCQETRRFISEGMQQETIFAHVSACSACQQFLTEDQTLEARIAHLPYRKPPADFSVKVMGRIARKSDFKITFTNTTVIRALPILSTVAACLVITAGWMLLHPNIPSEQASRYESTQSANPLDFQMADNDNTGLLADAVGF